MSIDIKSKLYFLLREFIGNLPRTCPSAALGYEIDYAEESRKQEVIGI